MGPSVQQTRTSQQDTTTKKLQEKTAPELAHLSLSVAHAQVTCQPRRKLKALMKLRRDSSRMLEQVLDLEGSKE